MDNDLLSRLRVLAKAATPLTDEELGRLWFALRGIEGVPEEWLRRLEATIASRDAALAVVVEALHAVCCAIEDRVQAPITESFFDVLGPAREAIADLPASAQVFLKRLAYLEARVGQCAAIEAAFQENTAVFEREMARRERAEERAETAEAKVVEETARADREREHYGQLWEEHRALKEKIATLERSQRTPGCHERCNTCNGTHHGEGVCSYSADTVHFKRNYPDTCPIAALKPGKDEGV